MTTNWLVSTVYFRAVCTIFTASSDGHSLLSKLEIARTPAPFLRIFAFQSLPHFIILSSVMSPNICKVFLFLLCQVGQADVKCHHTAGSALEGEAIVWGQESYRGGSVLNHKREVKLVYKQGWCTSEFSLVVFLTISHALLTKRNKIFYFHAVRAEIHCIIL